MTNDPPDQHRPDRSQQRKAAGVGSGTTVATAIQLGRKGIGIDLSFKYLHENAKARVDEQRLPLMEMMTDFAETAQIAGKNTADSADMVNYVPCKTKRE